MSFEKAVRGMIREEIEAQLKPVHQTLAKLQNGAGLDALRNLAERLAPLGSLFGGGRRRGRPAGAPARRAAAGKWRRRRGSNDRLCALMSCKRPARSKGYCGAHYQKYRNLARTRRLPSDWVEHAAPGTVKDVVLPRGRAAAKVLAAGRK